MRVYIPATFGMLKQLDADGLFHPRSGWAFAATPALTEFYTSGDEEEIELIAFDDAALASLRLLAIGDEEDFPHRRVVVSPPMLTPPCSLRWASPWSSSPAPLH